MSEPLVARPETSRGAGRAQVFPMSFAQARLWVLDRFAPGDPAYNIPATNRFQGWINDQVLQRAIHEIVRRHEALRTTFAVVDGRPSQVVASQLAVDLEVVDLRPLSPGPDKEARLGQIVYDESRRPFDLARGPLLRSTLVRLEPLDSVLILVMHHIVSDGWSSTVLYRELGALYGAFLARRPSPLPELPIQYADYAVWQSRWLTGDRLDEQLDYWGRQLAGLRPVLDLPTDRPRPPVQSHRGDLRGFQLGADVMERLKAMSQAHGATLFMTLLAGFKALLHRLSGETDIAVGIPIANRTRAELEGLIGFFVNTLVLRTDLSGDPTFGELVERVREVALGAYAHQDLPFEKLVDELEPQRNLEHNPLFQIMFAVQNIGVVERGTARGQDIASTPVSGNGTAKFDLTLSLQDTGGGAGGFLEFNTDLFDPPTVDRMIYRYQSLLAAAARDGDRPISELPLGGEDETEEADWTGPEPSAATETVASLLERRLREDADGLAVVTAAAELTWDDLASRLATFARGLAASGVEPGALVGIALAPGADAAVAIWGTLAAGCRVLALDPPRAPPDDDGGAGDADAPAPLRLDGRSARAAATLDASLVVVDGSADDPPMRSFDALMAAGEETAEAEPAAGSPDDVAWVVARTGPDGRLDGVELRHRDLLRHPAHPGLALEPADRVAFAAPLTADAARFELFAPLASGAAVVPLPGARTAPPRRLATQLRELGVTVLYSPLTDIERLARDFPWALRKVRLLVDDHGETDWGLLRGSLAAEILSRIHLLASDPRVGGVFAVQPLGAVAPEAVTVPLGEPAAGVTLRVEGGDRPAPDGVPGDLVVTAPGADRGRRIGHRVRRLDGPVLEPRHRPDGRLRIDSVELDPAEVEAALEEHPAVAAASVGPRRRTALAPARFAALYRLAPPTEGTGGDEGAEGAEGVVDPGAEELAAWLGRRLPARMVPERLVAVDALPRDRRSLADRLSELDDPSAQAEPYVEPRNDLESILVQLWMDTLGTERIGVKDNFFRLGGHSLLATQVVARIGDTFQIDFPLQRLFEHPTVETLAQAIEPLVGTEHEAEARNIGRVSRDRPLPLSFAQQRLWFLDQFEPDSAFYNISMPVQLPGVVDPALLAGAFEDLVARHETLRTTFRMVDGQPRQIIAPPTKLSLPVDDLRSLAPDERQRQMDRLTHQESQAPFDLETGPVLRARLVRLGATDNLLLATVHHIAADGWSTEIFFRELLTFYEARRTGRPAQLPELPIQYADFAAWQRRWLSGARLDEQIEYWRDALDGAPPLLELPTDRPRPAVQTFSGGLLVGRLPTTVLDAVRTLSTEQGTTLFPTLLAAFEVLLHRYTGREDLILGTPIANRTRPEVEGLIGFFANTLVIRNQVDGSLSFRQLIDRIHRVAVQGYAHQDIPFERLVEELHPERSLSYNPLFQVMFALQNLGRPRDATAGPATAPASSPASVGAGAAKFDLTMFVTEAGQYLELGIEYNSDLFDRSTVQRVAEHYEHLLRSATASPDAPIRTLSLLGAAESARLAEWNQTAAPVEETPVHRLFERQAEATPDAPAVRLDDRSLTYRQLDRRADAWAARLVELGVGPDTPVGLCLERSPEMVTAVLATLKAGAGYLPLDPRYPRDRIAFMLEDSGARAVLTQRHLLVETDGLEASLAAVATVTVDELPEETDRRVAGGAFPDALAYMIYTSGSTGRPKGVAMPHGPLSNLIAWQIGRSDLPPGTPTLQFASLSFDVSFQEIFSTLCAGGVLVLVDEERRRDAAALLALLDEARVARLFLPYVALQQLAEQARHGDASLESLREVITAGEQLHVTPEIRALVRASGARLHNQYGPSETHVVSELTLDGVPDAWPAMPTIGRPIPNATLHVLDPAGETCPIGVPGELHLGGLALARGYAARPALTAERFAADPHGADGGRLYATGDRARYLADGTVQFLGRLDEQVKVRGFRVEPGEVEAMLRDHPGVVEAVVVPRRLDAAELRLEAFVQTAPGDDAFDAAELRRYLAGRLPEYMVPAVISPVDELPLTPSGKLDRRQLIETAPAPMVAPSERVDGSQTPVQESLAAIWREILQVPHVGLDDDFFELGGHSLLATRVISRIREQMGIELPVREMFEKTTLEAFSLVVVEAALVSDEDEETLRFLAELEAMDDDQARSLIHGDGG